jgi:hypothetical protein
LYHNKPINGLRKEDYQNEKNIKKIFGIASAALMAVSIVTPTFALNNKFHWIQVLPRMSGETKIAHAGVKDPKGNSTTSVWLNDLSQGDSVYFNVRIYQSGEDQFGEELCPTFSLKPGQSSTKGLDRHINQKAVLELTGGNSDKKIIRTTAIGDCNFG